MAQQPRQYNETLENICSFSQPANHLVVFQLMRSKANEGVERNSAKPEYFAFVTIAPGEGDQANRTYNFQNSINVKYSLQEICALGYVLKMFANGMGKVCTPYVKFAKSNNGSKQVSVWEAAQQAPQQNSQGGQGYAKARSINLSLRENNNQAISIPLTPEQAFAISESLNLLFVKGMNLEFERQINSPKTTNNKNGSYGNLNQQNGFGPAQNNNGFAQSSPPPQNNNGFGPPDPAPFNDPFGNNQTSGLLNDFTNILMTP
jgi:hypothetical protein